MPFNSLSFVLLLLATRGLAVLFAWPGYVLIVASVVFYAAAGRFDGMVFLAAVCVNWVVQMVRLPGRWRVFAAVVVNIGMVFLFKYKSFFLVGEGTSGGYIDAALPLGISFYCFQALAYHIDVLKGRSRPATSFRSFLLFICFFPQLIAGPIVRATQFLPQVERVIAGSPRRLRLVSFGLALCPSWFA